jgi:sRNA-binding carbon storage regulator CsrA
MLILSRKLNESIVIDGRIIVKIHRQEVFDMIQKNKQASLNAGTEVVPKSPAAQVTPITDKSKAPPLPPVRGNQGYGQGPGSGTSSSNGK